MRQSVILSTLFAAVGVLGAPSGYQDTSVTVILQDQATELGSQTTFKSVNSAKTKAPVGSSGQFSTIEISVGKDANAALRCQALGEDGLPIAATRGTNFDITFSDSDKGEWLFDEPTIVSAIVCDPAFVGNGFDVTVILSNDAQELATQTLFDNFVSRAVLPPTASSGPFTTVEIRVGPNAKQDLRCRLLDIHGRKIVAIRGENVDTTFSDADKGAWTFQRPQAMVGKIICDPAFVAAPQ